jgi:methylmalonyl-CoA mutase N-terminal domain/subunit
MALLFDGIPLDKVSTSMTINATAIILLALYVAVGKRRAWRRRRCRERSRTTSSRNTSHAGTYIYPPQASLRIVTDIFAFCEREGAAVEHDLDQRVSHSRSGIDGGAGGRVHLRERDRYVEAARSAGLDVNSFGQRLSFFFNAHNDFPRGSREVPAPRGGCGRGS